MANIGILLFALCGGPIFAVMGLFAISAFFAQDIEISAVAIEIYRMAQAPTLLTIPLFTFAGYLLAESNSPTRLLKLAEAWIGWIPGGVAIVSLCVCAFFTAFTGASGVTIIALGGLIYPMLLKEGFGEKFSLGLITTSGSLGLLFPPSLPVILYGIVAKVDINQLFLAGIIPGFLLVGLLSLYAAIKGKKGAKAKTIQREAFSLSRGLSAVKEARYELPLPLLVLGGIYGGLITVTEAAAITAFYSLVVVCFLYKDVSWKKDLMRITSESMTLVGAILLILACALGVTNYLVDEEVPMKALEAMRGLITNKYMFLLCLNVFLLLVGSLMDIFSAIIVVVPLILPIAESFDVHPIHLAVIFLTNLEIGYITPPVGINLFISSFRFNKSVIELYKASFPFLILLMLGLLAVTYIPELSLIWL